MSQLNKWAGVLALVAIVIAIGGYAYPKIQENLGATGTRFPNGLSTNSTSPAVGELQTTTLEVDSTSSFEGAVTVGTSGSGMARINTGFCNIHSTTNTIAATTTATVSCQAGTNTLSALTGVTAGDICFLSLATTSINVATGVHVAGASASSTAGYIHAEIGNLENNTFTWTAAASTSWPYICIDPA